MRDRTVEPMNVSAIIVTRGDVDLAPVLDSLPDKWERIVWDNGLPTCSVYANADDWRGNGISGRATDLSVYGRYAAIEYASHDLIYVQDDDVIVSEPEKIADTWGRHALEREYLDYLVANMPQEFRHDGYTDSCLVGFGACFHRDLPERAFDRWYAHPFETMRGEDAWFNRTCDVVFTTLAPARVLVDVPITHREFASDPNRMWKQPGHIRERARMLELARKVRDA